METVRLDGTIRTSLDVVESIKDIKQFKKLDFMSWLDDRKQFDFTYDSYLGEVKCSVVKEYKSYSGDLKFNDVYYKVDSMLAKEMFAKVLAYIEKNKNN